MYDHCELYMESLVQDYRMSIVSPISRYVVKFFVPFGGTRRIII